MTHRHTPGQWRYTEGGIIDNDCAVSDPSEYREIANVYGAHILDKRDLAPSYEEAQANAKFIVRACNGHAELLATLKIALRAFDSMYLDIENGGEFDDIFDNQSYWPMETIKTVIAKHEGASK